MLKRKEEIMMNKFKSLFIPLLFFFVLQSVSVFAQFKCDKPKYYDLSEDEVNSANSNFYCWEIRYLKRYHNTLSSSLASYYNFYAKDLSDDNI